MAKTMYKVQVGAYSVKANALKMQDRLIRSGVPAVIVNTDGFMKVQCGAFSVKKNAERRLAEVKKKGFAGAVLIIVPSSEKSSGSAAPSGPDKVYSIMKPYIDSESAHEDFVKDYNRFISEYNKKHGTKHSQITSKNAWCTEFVDLMFYRAGLLDLIGYGKTSGQLMEIAKKNGTWKDGRGDIIYGDVVIYKDSRGNPNHTEFALGGKDFVSGNYNGGVHRRHRSSLSSIKGRIRPKYPE